MDPDSMISGIAGAIVFVILGGFLTLCEAAAVELGDAKLKRDAENDPRAAKLYALTKKPGDFIFSLQAGASLMCYLGVGIGCMTVLPGIVSKMYTLSATAPKGAVVGGVLFLFILFSTIIIALLAQAIPRQIGARYCDRLAYALSGAIGFFAFVFRPFAGISGGFERLISRLFFEGQGPDAPVTEEEIRMMVDVGEEHGSIEQAEREMINNIFEFDDRTVAEVMTHRTDLSAVDVEDDLGVALDLSIALGFSRIPVYRDTLDTVVGVLYIKDILPLVAAGKWRGTPIDKVMRPVLFIPESTHCMDLFLQFKQKKLQFAVVVDEYGGTSGVVTMEDLLESIVGNIQDEYDNEAEDVEALDDGSYTLDGSTTLDDVERILDLQLPEDAAYETIGGLLVELLDRIPAPGENPTVEIDDWLFTVLEVDDRRIAKIRAERIPTEGEALGG